MATVDLTRFIIPVELDNTDENQKMGNRSFKTKDYVLLDSDDDIKDLNSKERQTTATDYAVMNGALLRNKDTSFTWYWLRSAYSEYDVDNVSSDGDRHYFKAYYTHGCARPALHLNLSSIISARSASRDFGKIGVLGDKHTIELGEYPKSHAKNEDELEKIFKNGSLTKTGKKYTGYRKDDGSFAQNEEFEYKGKRYVRVVCKKYDDDSHFSDGKNEPETGKVSWALVEPIVWNVRNWDDLPREINPKGTGKAKYIDVQTEEGILSGLPFYPEYGDEKGRDTMWQNSPIRAFLNGYDLHREIERGNGNKKYKNDQNFNFAGRGLLQEAGLNGDLVASASQSKEIEQQEFIAEPQARRSRLEKLNPDKTPVSSRRRMTDTEMIKSWIDAGQSVLLRGPSGIGKTERLKKLYPDLIYIKLTNNMFPEKVVGSMNLQTGQSIPPDFAKQALMACATDDERKLIQENIQNLYDLADTIYERSKTAKGKVVIMLDELLNVKPAVQSLVYTLVLNKLVETGKGLKLPANTVVVATGNQKKYSNVAEDLAEPLEKRFDHILDMEPKVGEWIYEFAIPSKIHPSVIGYIFSKYQENRRSEKIEDMGYFYEEPEVGESHLDRNGCRGRTNDPRGWESISRTLYAFEEDLKNGKFVGKDVETLLRASIGSKLREEWAEEFFDFYNHPTLTVEEIVEKRYTQADLPTDINEKFATMAGLLNATPEQVGVCREFIRKHCDPEYLSVYDIYWAGNDEKRMEKIAELREISAMQLEDEGGLIR